MNELSLQYSAIKNQPSWIDDPFELGGLITGVSKVNNKQSNLHDYALELVSSYASFDDSYQLELDDLPLQCRLNLAQYYIESIDREIEWACYGDDESINSEFLCALIAMLKNNSKENQINFSKVATKNILIYYKDTLNSILSDACDEFFNNEAVAVGWR